MCESIYSLRLTSIKYLILGVGLLLASCQQDSLIDPAQPNNDHEDTRGRKWNRIDTGSETHNGIRVIVKFDEVSASFIGTLENISGSTVQQVQLGVHVFDQEGKKTEYGPTQAQDLAPNVTKQIVINTSGEDNFISYSMHPKTG